MRNAGAEKQRTRSAVPRALASAAVALGLLLAPGGPHAADTLGSRFLARSWHTDNGLPQNGVHAILQTRDGYVWLGTGEGLVRFDGVTFATFDPSNTPAMSSGHVTALYEDVDGSLWVGTRGGGVLHYVDGTFSALAAADGLATADIRFIRRDGAGRLWVGTARGLGAFDDRRAAPSADREWLRDVTTEDFAEDAGGAVWIATLSQGLVRYAGSAPERFASAEGVPDNAVYTLLLDRDGALWAGSRGLFRFRDGRWSRVPLPGGGSPFVMDIVQDHDGSLWLATSIGVYRLRGTEVTRFTTADGLPADSTVKLMVDRSGRLWVGTLLGLALVEDGRVIAAAADDGLPGGLVRTIVEDREGGVWVGTDASGVTYLGPRTFRALTSADGLPDGPIAAVLPARAGGVWVASFGGRLSRVTGDGVAPSDISIGYGGAPAIGLAETPDGALWIGGAGGLSRVERGRTTRFTPREGFSSFLVFAVAAEEDGTVWAGTPAGLSRYSDGQFRVFTPADGLPNFIVTHVVAARGGGLWIGTTAGLARMRDGLITQVPTGAEPPGPIDALYEDRDGAVWVGTRSGLLRLNGDGSVARFGAPQGLLGGVSQIVEDGAGFLWLGSGRGIVRATKADLERVASGSAPSIHAASYGVADGMPTRECSALGSPSCAATPDGRLWFATVKGLAVVDPAGIRANAVPPPVVVESVVADDAVVRAWDGLELGPGLGRLEVRYTAPSFADPERVRFRYKLEGYDAEWVEAGTSRVAHYTSLPPGAYTFRVVACNDDGVWNEAGAALPLTLRPAFHQTGWFAALWLAAAALAGWALYRLRVRTVRRRFAAVLEERTRIAREIHDTLAQGFVGISLQLESVACTLRDAPEEASSHLDRTRLLVRECLAEARRSVWDLRAQALERGDLERALAEIVRPLDSAASIRVRVRGTRTPLTPEAENNLLRIGQEAVTNAVKHARARRITVELSYEPDAVRLSVRDDGRGIDVAALGADEGAGFGLLGMRERAERLGGRLELASEPGRGTEVVVAVPVGAAARRRAAGAGSGER